MSDAFDGARVKINRAWEHLKCLEEEIRNLPSESKTVRLGQKFNSETNIIEVATVHVPELPPRLGAIAADAAQNFRTALNYMAWELAKWNLAKNGKAREPKGSTQFPIADSANHFGRSNIRAQYANICPDHVMVIEYFQPYGGKFLSRFNPQLRASSYPQWFIARHPLIVLREFTNADKHRAFYPVFLGTEPITEPIEGIDCEVIDVRGEPVPHVFELNTKWLEIEVRPTGPYPRVKMQDTFTPQISFQHGMVVMVELAFIGKEVGEILSAVDRLI